MSSETIWIMISAIATALMAVVTGVTLIVTMKQHRDAMRAHLLFSIVRKEDYVMLKVANVGNSIATDVHIHFSQNFHDMLLTQYLKEKFALIEKTTLSIDAHDSKYYRIAPVASRKHDNYKHGNGETYTQTDVNAWHKQNDKVKFEIFGKYCEKYYFRTTMSIYSFLNVGAVEQNDIAVAIREQNAILEEIKRGITKRGSIHNE